MNQVHRLKPIVVALAGVFAAYSANAQVPTPATLPTGGRVVSGQATILQSGPSMVIQQDSAKAILNWNSFSIGSQASVQFQQPSSSAVVLNRVLGSDPSAIYGSLSANGQVFLINPSGVVFGRGARVDVGALVASTLDIRDADFLSGNLRFTRQGAASSVLNEGDLVGRYVALLAPEVRNEGVIVARQGTAALAAGDAVTLNIAGSDLVGVQVDRASIDTLVQNGRLIQADAGTVILSAQSARGLVGRVVNSGTLEANGISTDGGVVRLVASSTVEHSGRINADGGAYGKGGQVTLIADHANADSRTTVAGSLSARGGSAGGDGGFVETSASRLTIAPGARVDTRAPHGRAGEWLLDPTDFTVAASGGDMTGADLTANLGTGNVTIQSGTGASGTNGDVFINDSVSWSANTLTLRAHRDVNVNSTMSAEAAGATLAVEYGQASAAGDDSRFTVNGQVNMVAGTALTTKLGTGGSTKNYTIVTDLAGLAAIDADGTSVQGNYALGTNLNISSGTWTPIGNTNGPLQGIFEGLGHTISGIANDPLVTENVGFIGQTTNGAVVQNVTVGVNLTGRIAVGGLVGNNAGGTIYNSRSTGTIALDGAVTGSDPVRGIGGLVGMSNNDIVRSRSSVNVTATGGQQDLQDDPLNPGFPGTNGHGIQGGIGGLVGTTQGGKVSNSYATGSVTGTLDVGGLVGFAAAPVENSYATGAVTGTTNPGGLVGAKDAFIVTSGSFWDTTTSGQGSSAGSETGLATAGMKTAANFTGAGWDSRIWTIADGSYPVFISGPAPVGPSAVTINLGDFLKTYGDTPETTLLSGFSYTGTLLGSDTLGGVKWGSFYTPTLGAGQYNYQTTANLLAPQFGFTGGHTIADYTVSYSNNSLTIQKADLTISGGRAYNGLTGIAGGILTATGVLGESFALSGAGTLVSKDVGTRAVQALGTLALGAGSGGALATNYNALSTTGSAVIVSKADLTLSGSRTYDGTTAVAGATLSAAGVNGETFSVTGTGNASNLASKDVQTGSTLASLTGLALGTSGNGGLAGNYNALVTTGSSYTIGKANLTLGGSRTYDGTTVVAGATLTATGVNGETFSVTGTGNASNLASKDVQTGSTLASLTGLALGTSGNGGLTGNYNALSTTGSSYSVAKANVTLSGSRAYDGTTIVAGGTLTATGVNGETFAVTGAGSAGNLAGKDVQAGSLLASVAGLALGTSGNGGLTGNYNALGTAGSAYTVGKANLVLSGSRTYDGTSIVAGSVLTANGVNGESFSVTGAGDASNLASRNVQTGSLLATLTGLGLGTSANGGVAGNYNALGTAGSSVTISAKALDILNLTVPGTVTAPTAGPVVLGGTPGLKAAVTAGSVAAGAPYDVDGPFTLTGTAQGVNFAASGQTLSGTVTGLSLNGTGSGNYTLTGATVSKQATSNSATDTTVANVVNNAGGTTTSASVAATTTTARAAPTTTTTVAPAVQATTTTEAPPPATVNATTSNPTPQPGGSVPIAVPTSDGKSTFDPTKPAAAVLVAADDSQPDLPTPAPKITQNADGTLKIDVTVPPATPPGVYIIAVVGTDAQGHSRVVVVPIVVRRRAGAA